MVAAPLLERLRPASLYRLAPTIDERMRDHFEHTNYILLLWPSLRSQTAGAPFFVETLMFQRSSLPYAVQIGQGLLPANPDNFDISLKMHPLRGSQRMALTSAEQEDHRSTKLVVETLKIQCLPYFHAVLRHV